MSRPKLLAVVGTRPETIKMAPVILALRAQDWAETRVLATAQHRELLDQTLALFDIRPDIDLDLMRPNQSLTLLTARLLTSLGEVLEQEKPDAVLAQGDTTTVMTAALACFYRHIPFAHVEAGLRTGDLRNPFPEEANRVIAGSLARWHYAPTERARQNLLRAGVSGRDILVTGNTVIDALIMAAEKAPALDFAIAPERRLVLVTAHRRENFGEPFERICLALRRLARDNPEVVFLYPVHPNPNVSENARGILGGHENIILCPPLDYAPFIAAMKRAHFIISDSGGVQEEAPALGKPVLVLRQQTERPEAVEQGVVKLVGADEEAIVRESQRLLDDPAVWHAMARGVSPYGDGRAAERIVAHLAEHLVERENRISSFVSKRTEP